MNTSIRPNRVSALMHAAILCMTLGGVVKPVLANNNPIITERLATNLKSYYGREAQALTINGEFCREDNYCVLTHEQFDVIVQGRGLIRVNPLTRVPMADNVEMCALVLNTLTGTPMQDAIRSVGIAFGAATQRGSFNQKVNGAKISIVANSTSDLACQIVR